MKIDQCPLTAGEKKRMIAEEAYYRYEKRGGTGGDSTGDWLGAEAEIEKHINEFCLSKPRKPELAADQSVRRGIRKSPTNSNEKTREDTIRDSVGKITKKVRELGDFIPSTIEKVGKMAKQRIGATTDAKHAVSKSRKIRS